jgi:hypothetical protein
LTPESKYAELFAQVQELVAAKQHDEAFRMLEQGVPSAERGADYQLQWAKVIHAQGLLAKAVSFLEGAILAFVGEAQLQQKRNEYYSQMKKLDNALLQIAEGQHTTPDVNFIKTNTRQLIDAACLLEAVQQLRALAVARKQKTTNILWIGHYLKDVFFHPQAEPVKPLFDDLLFEEMLFYYLKACKLFEPEYKLIQEAKKLLK